MKLTEQEAKVIWATQHRANASVAQVAKLTGLRPHVIRHALHSLINSGIIVPMAVINSALLKYQHCEVYFSINISSPKMRSKFIETLCKHPQISLVLEFDGDYEFVIKLWIKTIGEITTFFEKLEKSFGSVVLNRAVALESNYSAFGTKLFFPKPNPEPVSFDYNHEKIEIDLLDHEVLRQIGQTPLPNASTIARKLGESPSTVEYRIKKLEKSGLIVGYAYLIQPDQLGILRFILLVTCNSFSSSLKKELQNFCTRHRNIYGLKNTVGPWDFEVGIEVFSNAELKSVVRELKDLIGSSLVKSVIMPVLAFHKICGYPFQDPPAHLISGNK